MKFNKAKQKMELLVANDNFIDEIKKLRVKWKIHQNGFTDDIDNQKWHHWIIKESDKYNDSADFGKQIRNSFELRKVNYKLYIEHNQKINESIPINAFNKNLKDVVKKYKLPMDFKNYIRQYLFFNNLDKIFYRVGASIEYTPNLEQKNLHNLEKFYIAITPETTLNDIKKIWPDVQNWKKRLAGYSNKKRIKKIPNLSRDKRILELYKQGKTGSQISKIIGQETGKTVMYYEIPKLIKRLKDKINTA